MKNLSLQGSWPSKCQINQTQWRKTLRMIVGLAHTTNCWSRSVHPWVKDHIEIPQDQYCPFSMTGEGFTKLPTKGELSSVRCIPGSNGNVHILQFPYQDQIPPVRVTLKTVRIDTVRQTRLPPQPFWQGH